MQNKNIFVIVLLFIIIVILIYVAFFKQQNPEEGSQVLVENTTENNKISHDLGDDEKINSQTNSIIPANTATEDPHILGAVEGAKTQNANFAGHYVITYIGCGSGCATIALYDKNTGKLYNFYKGMLAGAMGTEQDPSVTWFESSVSSDILSLRKKTAEGFYLEQWKLFGDGFVKVQ